MPGLARVRPLSRLPLWLLVPLCAVVAASSADSAHAGRGRLVRSEEKVVEIHAAVGNPAEVADSRRQSGEDAVVAAVAPDGAVEGHGFRDQAQLAAPSTFRDLDDEDDSEAEMLEEEAVVDASEDMEHSLARLGRTTIYSGVDDYALKFCAKQGDNCTCDGIVGYGSGKKRVFERITGVVECVGANFAEEPGTLGNDCLCYNLVWCKNGNGSVTDAAHRRRTHVGVKGEQTYQRRRWCGWGPRDCQWDTWGSWSDCTGKCGTGEQKRLRQQKSPAVNGGHCKDESTGSRPCTLASCSHGGGKHSEAGKKSTAGGGAGTPHHQKTTAEAGKHSTAGKNSTAAKAADAKKHAAANKTTGERHVEGSKKAGSGHGNHTGAAKKGNHHKMSTVAAKGGGHHKKSTVAAKGGGHHKKPSIIATEV